MCWTKVNRKTRLMYEWRHGTLQTDTLRFACGNGEHTRFCKTWFRGHLVKHRASGCSVQKHSALVDGSNSLRTLEHCLVSFVVPSSDVRWLLLRCNLSRAKILRHAVALRNALQSRLMVSVILLHSHGLYPRTTDMAMQQACCTAIVRPESRCGWKAGSQSTSNGRL